MNITGDTMTYKQKFTASKEGSPALQRGVVDKKKIQLSSTPRLETTINKIRNNSLRMLKRVVMFCHRGDLMNKFDMFCYSAFARGYVT